MKIKKIKWSEPQEPNNLISYNHVLGQFPLGNFLIDWKGWKENPSYEVCFNDDFISSEYCLEAAKESAQSYIEAKVKACLEIEY